MIRMSQKIYQEYYSPVFRRVSPALKGDTYLEAYWAVFDKVNEVGRISSNLEMLAYVRN